MNIYLSKNQIYNQYNKNNNSLRTKALLISQLISKGVLAKIDNNKYKIVNKKQYHIYREYDQTNNINSLFNELKFDYIIYNITFLNDWLNQLIGKNIIFIEADKKYLNTIYDILKDNNYNNILLNPTNKEIDKYLCNESIIIKPLFTRSPINKKEKSFMIEKVLVDLFVDNILRRLFSLSELPEIYRQILSTYTIDESKLNAYLTRRRIKHSFYEFLKNNELDGIIND